MDMIDVNIGLLWNQRSEDALTLIEQMTLQPDEFICTIVFSLCANLTDERSVKLARKVFEQMPEDYRGNTVVMTAALHMLVTVNDADRAKEVFASISAKDSASYGAMIKGYYLNDNPTEALNLFWQMRRDGIEVDGMTYVTVVKTCSEIGMIEYSRSIAAEIPERFLSNQILRNTLIDMWASCIVCPMA